MDTAFMRKTFALIAKGLIEKEQLLQTEPTRYPYSKAMQHGINMFLAASQWAGSQAAVGIPTRSLSLRILSPDLLRNGSIHGNRELSSNCIFRKSRFMPMTPLRIKKPVTYMFPARIAMSSWKRRTVTS